METTVKRKILESLHSGDEVKIEIVNKSAWTGKFRKVEGSLYDGSMLLNSRFNKTLICIDICLIKNITKL
ncbi:MAG: hypothetical protein LBK94_05045 [Prevotellaceae bacterium]|jgi:hypothetical protein|nr:hypothetical protein [Prevotellaceae bacterium]